MKKEGKQKINIAKLLKYCPGGMCLDCTMVEGLEFDEIVDAYFPIRCRIKNPNGGYNVYNFTEYGCWTTDDFAKCVIFPKGKTTWEGFVPPCKFKVGDIIQDLDGYKVEIFKVDIDEECYEYISIIAKGIGSIPFKVQDEWELAPNKFDITTLKPFDKVLVRDTNRQVWTADLFSHIMSNTNPNLRTTFVCVGHYPDQCIPYEGNEHLLGKTDDCNEFYKTWE